MLNKLLIKLLNHKLNELMPQKCKQCYCDIFYDKEVIKDMIIDLKGRRI